MEKNKKTLKSEKLKGLLTKDPEGIVAITKTYLSPLERQELESFTIDEKSGICYSVNLQGRLGTILSGIKVVSKGYHFQLSNYPFYRIGYTVNGQATIKDRHGEYIADAGSIYFFTPREIGVVKNEYTVPWQHIYIHFTGDDIPKLFERIQSGSQRVLHVSNPTEIQSLFENIVANCREQAEYSQTICDSFLRILLLKTTSQIIQSHTHSSTARINYTQCSNYIKDNFSNIISLEDIAQNCCINKIYLCRLFKQYAGISPMVYVTKLKMNKAALLLMQTDYSIKQISLMLHFDNQYYFSRTFKKIYGVAPKLYRKRHS